MSHTTSNFHDVAGITVSTPECSPDKTSRWQRVRISFSDGSTHEITAFLAPGARSLPLGDRPATLGGRPVNVPLGPPFSEPFGSARPATEYLQREPRTIGEAISGAWVDETLLGQGSLFDKPFGQGDLNDG